MVEGDGRCHVSARWSGRTVGNVSCDNICLTGVSDLGEAGITADDRTGSSGLTAIGGRLVSGAVCYGAGSGLVC